MQIQYLHKNIYKLYRWARTQECLDAYRLIYESSVRSWEALRAEGVSEAKCADFTGISRATYYRRKSRLEALNRGVTPPSKARKRPNNPRWGEAEKQLVLSIRRENPTWGKFKIGVVIRRDHGLQISDSTVGRIITSLKEKGLVTRAASAPRKRRWRNFSKSHAERWTYKEYKDMAIGERVQIDHMTVTKNGITVKHFQAWDRRSKYVHAQIYSNATARSARRFLNEFLESVPYTVSSIQVDGGSEFMAEFEEACAGKGLELLVLPPSKPQYNGGVERTNKTFREDFYRRKDLISDSVGDMRCELRAAVKKYNTYRPHNALQGSTPLEYLQGAQAEKAA